MDELEPQEERNARDEDWNELLNQTWMKGILLFLLQTYETYMQSHNGPLFTLITSLNQK